MKAASWGDGITLYCHVKNGDMRNCLDWGLGCTASANGNVFFNRLSTPKVIICPARLGAVLRICRMGL